VIANPQTAAWKLAETPDEAVITTAQIEAHVNRRTGSVRILDAHGATILSEQDNGTWLTTVHTDVSALHAGNENQTIAAGQKFVLDPAESLYGLGQHPELNSLNLVGHTVRLLQENMEVAIPVLLSSKGYLLLWDNPAVTNVDLGKTDRNTVAWQSAAGSGIDYYFVLGPSPDQAIAGYRWLTGPAPLFPRWARGFWQSRERYKTQNEILGIVAEYRKRGIPLDGIIQDWQYWPPLNQETAAGGWGSHEFDPARYPDPAAMMKTIHDEHAHLMISVWPKFDVTSKGIGIPNLQQLDAVHGAFNPAMPFVFPPGHGKWYDPFNAQARAVYWKQLDTHLFSLGPHLGVDGWWLDASEPELSGNWGEFRNFTTALGPGALVYNAYPLEHTRAVYEGQRAEASAKRVFLLTRSAYAGQQRNAAVTWSGDITSSWKVFQQQIPAGLNFVSSGIPYWNTDIGGFFGNNPDDPDYVERFTRWFQFGAFTPMFRVHGTDKPKEVWRFNESTQKILTNYIQLRYHLLPYIYSASWMVDNGSTMMRPLVFDFPDDTQARDISDQFLFGPALLVNPVTHPGAHTRPVYLPKGTRWTDFWTGQSYAGGQTIDAPAPIETMPLYVRAGSILPYGPSIQYASEKLDAPIELRIYPGADGDFTLYEDEGDNYNYEHGAYSTIPMHWDDKTATLTIGARQGGFPGMFTERRFRITRVSPGHGSGIASAEKPDAIITYRGQQMRIH
jgi:alpha-D-xyloside xylohydrolase